MWDHQRTPGCADSTTATPPRTMWYPFTNAAAATHFPQRHNLAFNQLYCDGHTDRMRQEQLHPSLFREPGYGPPIAAYPGQ
jgi:prepilin-type processing-associated H-X9-DG protein